MQPASVKPPVAPRRRGRGTFNQPLRAEQQAPVNTSGGDGGSAVTTLMTTVLPVSAPPLLPPSRAPEEDLAAEYGGQKPDIPLNIRENFGVSETDQEVDTVRQLLFRGEKRRRYCIIVGDLQNPARPVTLKLFGHKGLKPFNLQNKLIRLVNISVGRPRVQRVPTDDKDGKKQNESSDVNEEAATRSDESEDQSSDEAESDGGSKESLGRPDEENMQKEKSPEQEQPLENVVNNEPKQRESVSEMNSSEYHAYEGVDAYGNADSVLPLTVELRDSTATNMGQPSSLANSPVLTATRFDTLQTYFFNEFQYLLRLEDVRMQHVSINLNLGAAYCCLAREGSYSTPLKYASFSEFVQRMNEESMQLYFLKDAPTCVSRAVDRECGALQSEAVFSLVKICFFSNERQSRSVARAMWDAHENRFVLLDMENSGVTFTWTVFSVDETGVGCGPLSFDKDSDEKAGGGTGKGVMRKKTVAFPFELELHAYRRWKQHTEHPAAPIAEAILDKLSLAEHNLIHYGSTIGYESMDLSHVCEVDAESEDFNVESIIVEHTSRVKPRGTDLTVDSTSSLWIENFAAARAFRSRMPQGSLKSAMTHQKTREWSRGRGRNILTHHGLKQKPLTPDSRLTFFRSRGSTVHWKLRPGCSTEENLSPLSEALRFAQQVINTANEIERTSIRGGAAPDAL